MKINYKTEKNLKLDKNKHCDGKSIHSFIRSVGRFASLCDKMCCAIRQKSEKGQTKPKGNTNANNVNKRTFTAVNIVLILMIFEDQCVKTYPFSPRSVLFWGKFVFLYSFDFKLSAIFCICLILFTCKNKIQNVDLKWLINRAKELTTHSHWLTLKKTQ